MVVGFIVVEGAIGEEAAELTAAERVAVILVLEATGATLALPELRAARTPKGAVRAEASMTFGVERRRKRRRNERDKCYRSFSSSPISSLFLSLFLSLSLNLPTINQMNQTPGLCVRCCLLFLIAF